jgi:hypothetical protein
MEWWGQRRSQGRGWRWRLCDVEGGGGGTKGGGVEGGGGSADVGSGIEGGGVEVGGGVGGGGAEVGQPDGAKPNFTAIRVSRRRGYSPYTRFWYRLNYVSRYQ